MAKLSTKQRKSMPAKEFAGPDRSFPVNDRSRAANAKARASQQVNAGRMAPATEAKIDTKANKVLGKGKNLPERGERTATNQRTRDVQHPGSHDEFEALGRD